MARKLKRGADCDLKPKLRFPEFSQDDAWSTKSLGEVCERITEKVGDSKLTTVSITAGRGFVSQAEKFGRDISGAQYEKYIYLRRGEFAYNKGNSNLYPQGCVYRLKEFDEAAASNAFICFRLLEDYVPEFFEGQFEQNTHGLQLIKYLTSGARSDGLLNIRPDEFFSVSLPIPPQKSEQQKIATFLSSLDELIVAESRKLENLQSHKDGLMQLLFPLEGETQPSFRFPEFQDSDEWDCDLLGAIFETTTGGTPNRRKSEYWNGDIPWVTTSLVDFNLIESAEEFISEQGLNKSSAKLFPKGTVLIALYGQGVTRGKAALLGIDAATNQACAAILERDGIDQRFTFLSLCARYEELRRKSNAGGQKNLSQGILRELSFAYPKDSAEQERIIDCLLSADSALRGQAQKIEKLKNHKKGLLQQLFPSIENAQE